MGYFFSKQRLRPKKISWFRKLGKSLHEIGEGADPLDGHLDHVPRLHRSDPSGSSCADEVSREEGHTLGEVVDQKGHGKDHISGLALLYQFPIQASSDDELGGIEASDDARSEGGESIKPLGPGELTLNLGQVPFGDVVEAGIAQNMVQGFLRGDVFNPVLYDHG